MITEKHPHTMNVLQTYSGSRKEALSLLQADLWLNLVIALFLVANPPSTNLLLTTSASSDLDRAAKSQPPVVLTLTEAGWIELDGGGRTPITNLVSVRPLTAATNCVIQHSREIRAGAVTDLLTELRVKFPKVTTTLRPQP